MTSIFARSERIRTYIQTQREQRRKRRTALIHFEIDFLGRED